MKTLGLKILIFFIFLDATLGTSGVLPGSSLSYGMIQFFSGIPSLFLLRRFIFNYLWKPKMYVNYVMEHYYS